MIPFLPDREYVCEICQDEGLYLKGASACFCSCAKGQQRKRAYLDYEQTLKLAAQAREKKRRARRRDFKSEAAGNGEEEVPF